MRSLLIRRTGVWGLMYTAYQIWRSIPPQHRQRVIAETKKHGPRVAKSVANRVRSPKPPKD
jgi:hypothetical protein